MTKIYDEILKGDAPCNPFEVVVLVKKSKMKEFMNIFENAMTPYPTQTTIKNNIFDKLFKDNQDSIFPYTQGIYFTNLHYNQIIVLIIFRRRSFETSKCSCTKSIII